MKNSTTLFRDTEGSGVVVGLPSGFDLNEEIKRAGSIYLTTAYAQMSGWKLLQDAFRESRALGLI